MERLFGLKIDVDTHIGMKRGVPTLLEVLAGYGLKGTFFLSVGPDNSGRAMLQFLRSPRFLVKMLRTKAARAYGWRTALFGTVLPAPMIALAFPRLVERIVSEGHAVQFHAWDHRRWQDDLHRHSLEWIRDWFRRGLSAFQSLTGRPAAAFGAPAWLIDDRVMDILGEFEFQYLSCTRGDSPFVHEGSGLIEIPSNLPCWEEIGGENRWKVIENRLNDAAFAVLPVHAEIEGGIAVDFLRRILDGLDRSAFEVLTLDAMKSRMDATSLPVRRYRLARLPGRAAPCAV